MQSKIRIISFGAPGSGKSHFANQLLGKPVTFKASKTTAGG